MWGGGEVNTLIVLQPWHTALQTRSFLDLTLRNPNCTSVICCKANHPVLSVLEEKASLGECILLATAYVAALPFAPVHEGYAQRNLQCIAHIFISVAREPPAPERRIRKVDFIRCLGKLARIGKSCLAHLPNDVFDCPRTATLHYGGPK